MFYSIMSKRGDMMILYAVIVALLIPAGIFVYRYVVMCGKIKKRLKVLGTAQTQLSFPKSLHLIQLQDMLYEKETEMAEEYFITKL